MIRDDDVSITELLKMADTDEEFFITSPTMNKALNNMLEIMHEKNKEIPSSFAIVTYMLGEALEDIRDLNQREQVCADMSTFIDAIFELHERTIN